MRVIIIHNTYYIQHEKYNMIIISINLVKTNIS